MILVRLFVVVAFLAIAAPILACDVCGCSLTPMSMGLFPFQQQSFLGLGWFHHRYRSHVDPEQPGLLANERFHSLEWRGRWTVTSRFQLMAQVPIAFLWREHEGVVEQYAGLSDISVSGRVRILPWRDSSRLGWQQQWWIGAGLKVPTGNFRLTDPQEVVNPNFQLGSGSWDGLFTSSYTANNDRWGFSADLLFRYSSSNPDDYRFGHRIHANARAFALLGKGKARVLPSAGWYMEWAGQDVDRGFLITESGGQAHFAELGMQWVRGRTSLGAFFHQPLASDWAAGQVDPQWRASAQFTFFF